MGIEAQTKNRTSSMKEFENLLNEDFKDRKVKEGEVILAKITEITPKFIVVDAKLKMESMIPVEEFKNDDELSKLKVGKTIEVFLERVENFRGEVVISRDKARRMNAWKRMEKVFETQEEMTGYITGRVKGGYICQIDGLPTFMPASQIDLRPLKKIDHLMNVPVKVIATRIDKNRGNVCTSRRAVLEKSKNAEVKEALKNIKEGDIVESRVKACTEWGIFLDINGVDALCHVSDISYGRVKKPSDLVTIGQKLKVRITKIDPVTNRVSASVKALTDDPYENIEKKYKVGEIYDGVCTKLMQYGVFVRLQEGVEGLIHNSCLSWTNKNIEPSKVLSSSQAIKVKIISIDKIAKRISLSYRDTLENPWKDIQDKVGSVVSAKIKNITDKAIFAEMESGLIGMIHYKEISFNENIDDLKKYKKNSLIKAKIIEVKDEKIRLSIRSLGKDPMSWFEENKKKVGSIISTKVVEVLKTGVKVAIDPEKKIVVTIKKNQLAVEPSDCRPEIYSPGNTMADAKILELDVKNRKIVLSPKAAAIDEEKSLVAKFGEGAAKSGATLKGIFEKALSGAKGKKKDKKE